MMNVTDGMVVYPEIVRRRLMAKLPFMATENIMMDAVKKGGDRQQLHERIREYSMIAAEQIKVYGKDSNLCELIVNDPMFMITKEELEAVLKPENYIGRSPQQVDEFLAECINPILEANKDILGENFEMKN